MPNQRTGAGSRCPANPSGRATRPAAGKATKTAMGRRRAPLGWLVFALSLAVAAELCTPVVTGFAGRPPAQDLNGWWVPREGFASTVLSLVPVASVLLVRQAIRSPGTRRLVGIAWDI